MLYVLIDGSCLSGARSAGDDGYLPANQVQVRIEHILELLIYGFASQVLVLVESVACTGAVLVVVQFRGNDVPAFLYEPADIHCFEYAAVLHDSELLYHIEQQFLHAVELDVVLLFVLFLLVFPGQLSPSSVHGIRNIVHHPGDGNIPVVLSCWTGHRVSAVED